MKQWLRFGVILLFVGSCTIAACAQPRETSSLTTRGDWLYVGGSGPGNYTKIQDAIDNATDGDTVFVYRGTYHEELNIQKSIALRGESMNLTIIDLDHIYPLPSGGIVMNVSNASNVTIENFCFINHFSYAGNTTGGIWADHCPGLTIRNISDAWHHSTDFGVRLWHSNHSTIDRMIIKIKWDTDIDVRNSSDVTISQTFIYGFGGGLRQTCGISLLNAEHTAIINNTITQCTLYGISLTNSHDNSLLGNTVRDNNASGMYLLDSDNNRISNNELSSNHVKGIFLENSQHNTISNNNIYGNDGQLLFFSNALCNTWKHNFWGYESPRIQPVVGLVHLDSVNITFPIWRLDWRPAKEPYKIPGAP